MLSEKCFDWRTLVGVAGIPEQDHMPSEVSQKVLEEARHLGGADVAILMETSIKSNASSLWEDAKSRDGRDLTGAASSAAQNGSLASGRPGSDPI